jgi:hypothetical protein
VNVPQSITLCAVGVIDADGLGGFDAAAGPGGRDVVQLAPPSVADMPSTSDVPIARASRLTGTSTPLLTRGTDAPLS